MLKTLLLALAVTMTLTTSKPVIAQDNTLHIYSSRHYNTDEALYKTFTEQTGIEIKRVDGKGDALIARLEQEGELSPADLFITVDSGRLWRAEQAGLFDIVDSETLTTKVPENFRHPDGKGRLCVRSSSNIYNQSLMASMIAQEGEEVSRSWAKGVLDNLKRKPQGGDTDQIKAVAAGVCDICSALKTLRIERSLKT